MNEDGHVVIGTVFDTKNFEKKYKQLETRLKNAKLNLEIKAGDLENAKKELHATEEELTRIKKVQDEINETISKKQKQYDRLNMQIQTGQPLTAEEYQRFGFLENTLTGLRSKQAEINKEFDIYNNKVNKANDLLAKTESRYEIEKNKVEQIKDEFQLLNQEIVETNQKHLAQMRNETDSIGTSVSGVIKKIGRWALAIFGIRSAYMFIRQAMSTLSQYNEQLATDVEYIRYALATTLQPIIEYIIKLVYQLLGLINSVAKAMFGVDLFANASANSFRKANKSAGELKKTLAGFDKLNVLNENGTTGAVGGISPSVDLSQMEDADLSGVTKLLDKVKGLFNKAFDTIVGNGKKVLVDLGASPEFINAWERTMESIKKTFGGLIDFMVGLIKMFVGLLSGNSDMVVEGAKQAVTGIKNFIVGLFDFIINSNTLAITAIKDGFNRIPEFFQGIKNRVVETFKNMGTSVGNAVGDSFKNVINSVLSLVEYKLNKPINAINSLISLINTVSGINLGRMSTIKLPRLAKGGILNMPGRGVDYYGANIAEHGREGVVPLDNKQSLETIGRTIARYATFNADITLELEGRILARVMEEINSNKSFARNGG